MIDAMCSFWMYAGKCEQYSRAYGNIGIQTWNENGLVTLSTFVKQ